MEKIEPKLNGPGTYELIVRQGEALPLEPTVSFSTQGGDIKNPIRYFKNRIQGKDEYKKRSVFTFNESSGKLKLDADVNDRLADEVTGTLVVHEVIVAFGISDGGATPTTFNREAFIKKLKLMMPYFPKKNDIMELIGALQAFEATTQGSQQKTDAGKGFSLNSVQRSATIKGLPAHLILRSPIFKSTEPVDILCEIRYDVTDNNAVFWLESVDVVQARIDAIAKIVEDLVEIEKEGWLVLYE